MNNVHPIFPVVSFITGLLLIGNYFYADHDYLILLIGIALVIIGSYLWKRRDRNDDPDSVLWDIADAIIELPARTISNVIRALRRIDDDIIDPD